MIASSWTGFQIRLLRSRNILLVSALLTGWFGLQSAVQADTYIYEKLSETAKSPSKGKISPKDLLSESGFNPAEMGTVVSRNAQPIWQPPVKSIVTVSTGPDTLQVQDKNGTTIFNFKNRKFYEIDSTKKTYVESSQMGQLAFRVAETGNRMFLGKLLGSAFKTQKSPTFDKFFNEAMFSIVLKGTGKESISSGYVPVKSKAGAETQYFYGKELVCSVTPSATPMSNESTRQLSRWMITDMRIHPAIRLDIEKLGKVPQKLMYYLINDPVSRERVTYSLKKYTPGNSAAAIPAGYTKTYAADDPLSSVYPKIAELKKPPENLRELTLERYKKSVEEKNYFDAMLTITEYGLQTGENLGAQMAGIKDQLTEDPECRKMVAGLGEPQNEKEATLSLGSLDMVDRSKSDKSYLIDIFRANLIINMYKNGASDVHTSLEKDPVKAFVSVLEHNPFIGGVYHDLGDFLEREYKQPYAWNCYDLARTFYPKHPFMDDINEKEKILLSKYPEFFQGDKNTNVSQTK